jgi:hypothetical protein
MKWRELVEPCCLRLNPQEVNSYKIDYSASLPGQSL